MRHILAWNLADAIVCRCEELPGIAAVSGCECLLKGLDHPALLHGSGGLCGQIDAAPDGPSGSRTHGRPNFVVSRGLKGSVAAVRRLFCPVDRHKITSGTTFLDVTCSPARVRIVEIRS